MTTATQPGENQLEPSILGAFRGAPKVRGDLVDISLDDEAPATV